MFPIFFKKKYVYSIVEETNNFCFLISLPAQPAVLHKSTLFILNVTKMLLLSHRENFCSFLTVALLLWVDSFKPWNDVGNLTLLSNVRFLTSFRRLEESTL